MGLVPASRPRAKHTSAAQSAAAAAARKTAAVLHFALKRRPPTSGPTIEPIRPTPRAQPMPVALTAVGEEPGVSPLAAIWPPMIQKPAAKIAVPTSAAE